MLSRVSKQLFSQKRGLALAVTYPKFGDPQSVLRLENIPDKTSINPDEVLVKLLAAPINPSDINKIQGVYGELPTALPAIAGNEGVGIISKIGSNVRELKEGDWVIPHNSSFATWRSEGVGLSSDFLKVSNKIPPAYAATLAVNPSTAYRILKDFENLKPGDVIIQNAANSMVGLSVIQLAREFGIQTINIVRNDRPNPKTMLKFLDNLGGTLNVTDDIVRTPIFREMISEMDPIRLAINSVGGPGLSDIARVLAPNATIVTIGGMSKQHFGIPADLFAAKQLKLESFWMNEWNKVHSKEERYEMIDELSSLVEDNKLSYFYLEHRLDDFALALKKSQEAFSFRKVILRME